MSWTSGAMSVGHAESVMRSLMRKLHQRRSRSTLSELKGLTVQQSKVTCHRTFTACLIGRLVEGNAKELAGRKKVDGERPDLGTTLVKVVGRCELIPPDSTSEEAKPEGESSEALRVLVVVKDGLVEDSEGNVVGKDRRR